MIKNFFIKLIVPVLIYNLLSCEKREGCTDKKAKNFDSYATENDGSCIYDFDENDVEINIQSPEVNQNLTFNDTLNIQIELLVPEGMHEVRCTLHKKGGDKFLFDYFKHEHSSFYSIDTFWVNKVNTEAELILTVRASDHNAREIAEVVNLQCTPD